VFQHRPGRLLSGQVLLILGVSPFGVANVAKDVATGDDSRVFAEMRGGRKPAVTSENVQARISADGLPLPYKQGVSSSSLLAPTLKAPSERPVSEHVRTSGWPIGSV
jgi:hypothetical protein